MAEGKLPNIRLLQNSIIFILQCCTHFDAAGWVHLPLHNMTAEHL